MNVVEITECFSCSSTKIILNKLMDLRIFANQITCSLRSLRTSFQQSKGKAPVGIFSKQCEISQNSVDCSSFTAMHVPLSWRTQWWWPGEGATLVSPLSRFTVSPDPRSSSPTCCKAEIGTPVHTTWTVRIELWVWYQCLQLSYFVYLNAQISTRCMPN